MVQVPDFRSRQGSSHQFSSSNGASGDESRFQNGDERQWKVSVRWLPAQAWWRWVRRKLHVRNSKEELSPSVVEYQPEGSLPNEPGWKPAPPISPKRPFHPEYLDSRASSDAYSDEDSQSEYSVESKDQPDLIDSPVSGCNELSYSPDRPSPEQPVEESSGFDGCDDVSPEHKQRIALSGLLEAADSLSYRHTTSRDDSSPEKRFTFSADVDTSPSNSTNGGVEEGVSAEEHARRASRALFTHPTSSEYHAGSPVSAEAHARRASRALFTHPGSDEHHVDGPLSAEEHARRASRALFTPPSSGEYHVDGDNRLLENDWHLPGVESSSPRPPWMETVNKMFEAFRKTADDIAMVEQQAHRAFAAMDKEYLPGRKDKMDSAEVRGVPSCGTAAREPCTTVVRISIQNVDFHQLDVKAEDDLRLGLRRTIAKNADIAENCVSVTLKPGSVQVIAKVSAPQGHSIRFNKGSLSEDVLQTAKSIEGVVKAAVGSLNVTDPEIYEEDHRQSDKGRDDTSANDRSIPSGQHRDEASSNARKTTRRRNGKPRQKTRQIPSEYGEANVIELPPQSSLGAAINLVDHVTADILGAPSEIPKRSWEGAPSEIPQPPWEGPGNANPPGQATGDELDTAEAPEPPWGNEAVSDSHVGADVSATNGANSQIDLDRIVLGPNGFEVRKSDPAGKNATSNMHLQTKETSAATKKRLSVDDLLHDAESLGFVPQTDVGAPAVNRLSPPMDSDSRVIGPHGFEPALPSDSETNIRTPTENGAGSLMDSNRIARTPHGFESGSPASAPAVQKSNSVGRNLNSATARRNTHSSLPSRESNWRNSAAARRHSHSSIADLLKDAESIGSPAVNGVNSHKGADNIDVIGPNGFEPAIASAPEKSSSVPAIPKSDQRRTLNSKRLSVPLIKSTGESSAAARRRKSLADLLNDAAEVAMLPDEPSQKEARALPSKGTAQKSTPKVSAPFQKKASTQPSKSTAQKAGPGAIDLRSSNAPAHANAASSSSGAGKHEEFSTPVIESSSRNAALDSELDALQESLNQTTQASIEFPVNEPFMETQPFRGGTEGRQPSTADLMDMLDALGGEPQAKKQVTSTSNTYAKPWQPPQNSAIYGYSDSDSEN